MEDYFIQKLTIKDVRDIKNLEIPLDNNERKHLIITGKNGCGKTSTLLEIANLLNKLIDNGFANIENYKKNIISYQNSIATFKKNIISYENNISIETKNKEKFNDISNKGQILQIENNIKSYRVNIITQKNNIENYNNNIKNWQKQIDNFTKVDIIFSNQDIIYQDIKSRKFILSYFKAKRETQPTVVKHIQNISLAPNYTTDTNSLHTQFIQYMVKLRVDMLDAKEENELEEVKRIEAWFDNFENSLKELFREESLKVKYYREELNFKIEYDGKSFGLNELSDGYSSLLAIITELILRMEAHGVKAYDMQGVVLIDEIETHLHVDLQKKVLPFLVSFFPKIQFIVTTHSPFVLSSLSNAVICDLESRLVVEDLSEASYSGLVRNYFGISSEYSNILEEKFKEFEVLAKKENLLEVEEDRLIELDIEFKNITPLFSSELYAKYIALRKEFLV